MAQMYANVIVDISHEKLDKTFQYRIPSELPGAIEPGMVVSIPFGKGNRILKGYVIEVTSEPAFDPEKTKSLLSVETEGIGPASNLIRLAAWIRNTYGSTMIQALKTVIPVKRKIQSKEEKTLTLSITQEEAKAWKQTFLEKHQTGRARVLEALLAGNGSLSWKQGISKWKLTLPVVQKMQEMQLVSLESTRIYRTSFEKITQKKEQFPLTPVQQQAVDQIWNNKETSVTLLHGVTGCGKTEIYMELIARTLKQGKQAIVLIPEIALTYQTVYRFYSRFGEQIAVVHSRLSEGEKYDQFQRAQSGDASIMIGPRSSLFVPFSKLGIIIIDEEQEDSYKSETMPRYDAREAAIFRGNSEKARVVLGSATPSVESYYRAKQGRYQLVTIKERVLGQEMPHIQCVDLRKEPTEQLSLISEPLGEMIAERLEQHEQVMLFLNRRGYASFISCRSCGTVVQCPHCNVSLADHRDGRLVCHYCGYERDQPKVCPVCGSAHFYKYKAGTQQMEQIVQKRFPHARILRMDRDSTSGKNQYQTILEAFSKGEADILLGTQMIVKGHDYPNVTLMGIVAADLSLYAGDYRSAEKTFQLLVQAAGRTGRGDLPGQVVIQTMTPEHYSIQCAMQQDYEAFYEQEIAFRTLSGYPPAGVMLTIHASGAKEEHLQMAMEYLHKFVLRFQKNDQLQILGPAEEGIGKIKDQYKKQMIVRGEDKKQMIQIRTFLEKYIEMNSGFAQITIQFEIE